MSRIHISNKHLVETYIQSGKKVKNYDDSRRAEAKIFGIGNDGKVLLHYPWDLISITTPGTSPLFIDIKMMDLLSCNRVLQIQFDDISEESLASRFVAFNEQLAAAVFDFLDQIKKENHLLVHCEAGLSRSPAIAIYAAKMFGLDPEKEFNLSLYKPNHLVLRKLNEYVKLD